MNITAQLGTISNDNLVFYDNARRAKTEAEAADEELKKAQAELVGFEDQLIRAQDEVAKAKSKVDQLQAVAVNLNSKATELFSQYQDELEKSKKDELAKVIKGSTSAMKGELANIKDKEESLPLNERQISILNTPQTSS